MAEGNGFTQLQRFESERRMRGFEEVYRMGFIYPKAYYEDFVAGTLDKDNKGDADTTNDQDTVYWNLYPVHYRELEAYVTVYCYFRREAFDSEYVDKAYDQLNGTRRNFWEKTGATNLERLNDPALEYNDPW